MSRRPSPPNSLTPGAEPEVDPVRAVQVGEDRRHLVAQHPAQRQRSISTTVTVAPCVRAAAASPGRSSRRRRRPPGRRSRSVVTQASAWARAQVVDAGDVRPGTSSGAPATRSPAAACRSAAARRRPGSTVCAAGSSAVAGAPSRQLDVVARVPVRAWTQALSRVLAEQVALRQRRPLVRTLGLLADQHDPAGEALRAQGLGRLGAGQRRADDHERLLVHREPPIHARSQRVREVPSSASGARSARRRRARPGGGSVSEATWSTTTRSRRGVVGGRQPQRSEDRVQPVRAPGRRARRPVRPGSRAPHVARLDPAPAHHVPQRRCP